MDDDAGHRSLFALLYYYGPYPPYYSILQLDHVDQKTKKVEVDEKVRFSLPPKPKALRLMKWSFSPPHSSTEDFYMVPNWGHALLLRVKPFHGYKFNIRTGSFLPINLPDSYSLGGSFVNLGPHTVFISRDLLYDTCPPVVLQLYDPCKNSWNALEPFPDFSAYNGGAYKGDIVGSIVATAVWGDTILLNVNYFGVCNIWAYILLSNKWYHVEVDNSVCQEIEGEAVVIGNTIYALTNKEVVAFSIGMEIIDSHLVFKCSLLLVEYMKPISCQSERASSRTRHLVHLGKDKFCVVQSVDCGIDCRQPIQVTYINIKRGRRAIVMGVMGEYFPQVKNQHKGYFMVELCFSLPEGALKEGEIFKLDPFNEDFEGGEIATLHEDGPHATSQRDNDLSQRNIIDEKGFSIYVRNLPPNATVRQLEEVFTKFGPIKKDGIRVGKDEDICLLLQQKHFASVEFGSRSSKKCAMEESTISIGGCQAEILEKRLTGLTLDDYIIQAVMNMSNDDENDPEPDVSSVLVLPKVSSEEALQAAITLQNYLLQHEQNIPEVVSALPKVKDGIEFGLATKKKQVTADAYFQKNMKQVTADAYFKKNIK